MPQVNCTGTAECAEHVDPPVYAANLVTIYQRLAARARNVIFATTTPVPAVPTSLGRTYAAAVAYNAAGVAALQGSVGPSLRVDDLWSAAISFCGVNYVNCSLQIPVNVHLEPAGQSFLGSIVANSILTALGQ